MAFAPLRLARHERDPDGDGLHHDHLPDESGLDDSPKYDAMYGWMATTGRATSGSWSARAALNYDSARSSERYEEHVEDVLVNVAYALGCTRSPA